jgi:hypothetical protein
MRAWCVRAVLAGALLALPLTASADDDKACQNAFDNVQSLRQSGKLNDALREAVHCAEVCKNGDAGRYAGGQCTQWVPEIQTSLPTIVIDAKDTAGKDTTAVRVSVDGKVVLDKLDGKAFTIDPGSHTLTFELAGQPVKSDDVVIKQGEKDRAIAVSFALPGPKETPPNVPVAPGKPSAPGHDEPPPPKPVWPWPVGALGLAALGTGIGFGVDGLLAQQDLNKRCPGFPACRVGEISQNNLDVLNGRKDRGLGLALGLGGIGVVGIGVAIVGLAVAPTAKAKATSALPIPLVGTRMGGVGMMGAW